MEKERFFRRKVKEYYHKHKRSFFWRRRHLTPFQILIIELFLKRTRAETVEKYGPRVLREFPNNKRLLYSRSRNILSKIHCFGLGNQRTAALRQIALYIDKNLGGKLPPDVNIINKIPHIGPYIASATLCFGFNKRSPMLDVNSSRIISRFFSIENTYDSGDNTVLLGKANELLPRRAFREYNWGLLDLGALFCRQSRPLCIRCPLNTHCNYARSKY